MEKKSIDSNGSRPGCKKQFYKKPIHIFFITGCCIKKEKIDSKEKLKHPTFKRFRSVRDKD